MYHFAMLKLFGIRPDGVLQLCTFRKFADGLSMCLFCFSIVYSTGILKVTLYSSVCIESQDIWPNNIPFWNMKSLSAQSTASNKNIQWVEEGCGSHAQFSILSFCFRIQYTFDVLELPIFNTSFASRVWSFTHTTILHSYAYVMRALHRLHQTVVLFSLFWTKPQPQHTNQKEGSSLKNTPLIVNISIGKAINLKY